MRFTTVRPGDPTRHPELDTYLAGQVAATIVTDVMFSRLTGVALTAGP